MITVIVFCIAFVMLAVIAANEWRKADEDHAMVLEAQEALKMFQLRLDASMLSLEKELAELQAVSFIPKR